MKYTAFLLAILSIAILAGCQQATPLPSTSDRITSFCGISLGMTSEEVIESKGTPSSTSSYRYSYYDSGYTVYFDNDWLVNQVILYSGTTQLNGVSIDDSLAEVRALLGEPSVTTSTMFGVNYYYNQYGCLYSFSTSGIVDYMGIYSGDE